MSWSKQFKRRAAFCPLLFGATAGCNDARGEIRLVKLPARIVLILTCVLVVIGRGRGEPLATSREIAVVEKESISADDVAVTRANALLRYKHVHGHEPQTTNELKEFDRLAVNLENEKFLEKMRHIIFLKEVSTLGIQATDAEVSEKWRQLTNGVDFQAAAKIQHETLAPLIEVLKAVYEQGEKPDAAFDRLLKDRMKKSEWEIHLNYYTTRERRKILETAAEQSPVDLQRVDPGIRPMLISEKLYAVIDSQIAAVDPKFAEFKKLKESDPTASGLKDFPPNYVAIKRAEWWKQQYRAAAVEIKDERFRGVWEDFLKSN